MGFERLYKYKGNEDDNQRTSKEDVGRTMKLSANLLEQQYGIDGTVG